MVRALLRAASWMERGTFRARAVGQHSPTFHTVCLIYAPPGAQRDVTSSAENMGRAVVRASNEAIVRHDGDGEKVGIGREGGERIPGFEVPELERLVGGSRQRAADI